MSSFGPRTYGDAFADVYDDWYGDTHDTEAEVATLTQLATGPRVLELAVGTGRLALALAAAGFDVTGLDASAAMLERLAAKPGAAQLRLIVGDMAALPLRNQRSGDLAPFDLIVVSTNSLCNVGSESGQSSCIAACADLLTPQGQLVTETFVPGDAPPNARGDLAVRSVDVDKVVLTATWRDPADQTVAGQHIELTEAGGVRLRPWHLRYLTPAQLDAMTAAAGLVTADRWANWSRQPFDDDATNAVSVFQRS